MGFGGGGGGSSSIATATDSNISNPVTNNTLIYTTGKWTNTPLVGTVALATGGGVETLSTANSTATTTLDLSTANVFNITLVVATTTFAFSNAVNGKACAISLYLHQDATGNRAVNWPASVKWAGGTAPTLTTTASAIDILVFESLNGGSSWFGSLVGANFS